MCIRIEIDSCWQKFVAENVGQSQMYESLAHHARDLSTLTTALKPVIY